MDSYWEPEAERAFDHWLTALLGQLAGSLRVNGIVDADQRRSICTELAHGLCYSLDELELPSADGSVGRYTAELRFVRDGIGHGPHDHAAACVDEALGRSSP